MDTIDSVSWVQKVCFHAFTWFKFCSDVYYHLGHHSHCWHTLWKTTYIWCQHTAAVADISSRSCPTHRGIGMECLLWLAWPDGTSPWCPWTGDKVIARKSVGWNGVERAGLEWWTWQAGEITTRSAFGICKGHRELLLWGGVGGQEVRIHWQELGWLGREMCHFSSPAVGQASKKPNFKPLAELIRCHGHAPHAKDDMVGDNSNGKDPLHPGQAGIWEEEETWTQASWRWGRSR